MSVCSKSGAAVPTESAVVVVNLTGLSADVCVITCIKCHESRDEMRCLWCQLNERRRVKII